MGTARVRIFQHPDGREWRLLRDGATLKIVIAFPDDDEPVERVRRFDDARAAERDAEAMVAEQLQEGFAEVSTPQWRAVLDELVEWWREDDPGFDAAALRDRFLRGEAAQVLMEAILQLRDPDVVDPDPRTVQALELLEEKLDQALPAVLLALRLPDFKAHLRLEALLGKFVPEAALPALYSVLEHPPRNLDASLGGRPVSLPGALLGKYASPDGDRLGRVRALLDSEDHRQVDAAHQLLAAHATDDRCFQVLFDRLDRMNDPLALALVRAAELRKDPRLRPVLEKLGQRRMGAGWKDRVRGALAGLPPG